MLLRIQLAIKGTDSPLTQQGIVSAEVVIILPLQENFHCILLPCVVTVTKYTRGFQLSFIWTPQAQMCILSLKMDSVECFPVWYLLSYCYLNYTHMHDYNLL